MAPRAWWNAGVQGAGVHVVAQAHLLDAPQPLEQRLFDDVEDQVGGNIYEPVYRIVDEFSFVQAYKGLKRYSRKEGKTIFAPFIRRIRTLNQNGHLSFGLAN
jgi:hypothetical protein